MGLSLAHFGQDLNQRAMKIAERIDEFDMKMIHIRFGMDLPIKEGNLFCNFFLL